MTKVKGLFLLFVFVLLVACGPVPFDEACDHVGQTITVTGYLATMECSRSGYCCGATIVPGGLQGECNFSLYGKPDQEGRRIQVSIHHSAIIGSFGEESKVLEMLCKNEPKCFMDGTSRFSVVGKVRHGSMEGFACAMGVDGFENARFIP